jgi:hypothetical protein
MINKVQVDMDSAWKSITDKEENAWKLRVLVRDQLIEHQMEVLQLQAQNPMPCTPMMRTSWHLKHDFGGLAAGYSGILPSNSG